MGVIVEKLYIATSMSLLNFIFMIYVARFWYLARKKYNSRAARAMKVSSILIAAIALVGLISIVRHVLTDETHTGNISLFMSGFTFIYVVIQVMLTKGYFNKEKNNG